MMQFDRTSIPSLLLLFVMVGLNGCQDGIVNPAENLNDQRLQSGSLSASLARSSLIQWRQRRYIDWQDFQATPVYSEECPEGVSACISTGSTDLQLSHSYSSSSSNLGIYAVMIPSESWVIPGEESRALLNHEQGHFDIQEYIVREHLQEANELIRKSRFLPERYVRYQLRLLKFKYQKRLEDEFLQYDFETNHGRNAQKQAIWDIFIAEELGLPVTDYCPEGTLKWEENGHCYQAVLSPGLSWEEAQSAASSNGGYLATITSQEENKFVKELFEKNPSFWFVDGFNNALGPWIGGVQASGSAEPGDGWGWVTNEPFEFSDWSAGNPDNCCGVNQNRIQFFRDDNADPTTWTDVENFARFVKGYIFECE